jgi:hypothetical protein
LLLFPHYSVFLKYPVAININSLSLPDWPKPLQSASHFAELWLKYGERTSQSACRESTDSALRAISVALRIGSEQAQWFRRGGVSDQKFEIEIIVSSPLDTSCELGKDILSPNIGLKANFF